MIRINLLPEEFRKSERTSPKLFAATLLSVILVCSAFGWSGLVYFGELGNLEVEESAVSERLGSKREQAGYHTALVKEKKDYEKRSKTIQTIGRSRVQWTRILDELVDVVNNEGDTERHLGWFKSLGVRPGDQKTRGHTVTCPGWVQGGANDLTKLADFHEDLENAVFFKDVMQKSAPAGSVETNAKRIPPQALYFSLKWIFKPSKDWMKNKKAGRGARKGD